MTVQCSIVIRCYNEEQHIGRLLSGIMQQNLQDIEIILVDSGSSDATLDIAGRFPVKIVHIKKEDFSFGRSLNMGCEVATGEFLVFASAHVYPVYQDWLAQMLKPFENDKVALVYGKQRGAETTKYSEHRVFAKWFPDTSDFQQMQPFCNNANVAIRRELWEKQSYDESLTGLEDLAWAKEIIEQGYYLAYNADAEIIHVHDETFAQVYNRYRREAIAFKRIYPEASFPVNKFLQLFLVNAMNDGGHAIQDNVLWREFSSILRFRWNQFLGTYRGYREHRPMTQQLHQTFYYPELKRSESGTASEREKLRISYHDF